MTAILGTCARLFRGLVPAVAPRSLAVPALPNAGRPGAFAPAASVAVVPDRTAPAVPFLWRPRNVGADSAVAPTWDGAEIRGDHGVAVRARAGQHGGHYYHWRLTVRGEGDVRSDFELSALWDHLADFPSTLAPFGIRRLDATTIEVPDAAELNGMLQAMGRPPLYWTRPDLHRATVAEYLDGLARGCVPYAAVGSEHFHDLGTHAAVLFFPPRCLQILAAKVQTWREISDDRRLSEAIRHSANYYLGELAKDWDLRSAQILSEVVEEFRCAELDVTMENIMRWLDEMDRDRRGRTWGNIGQFQYLFGCAEPDQNHIQTFWDTRTRQDAASLPRLQGYLRGLQASCATPKECHALLAETIYNALGGR